MKKSIILALTLVVLSSSCTNNKNTLVNSNVILDAQIISVENGDKVYYIHDGYAPTYFNETIAYNKIITCEHYSNGKKDILTLDIAPYTIIMKSNQSDEINDGIKQYEYVNYNYFFENYNDLCQQSIYSQPVVVLSFTMKVNSQSSIDLSTLTGDELDSIYLNYEGIDFYLLNN